MLRWGFGWANMRPEAADRVAYTVAGLLVLVFWALPSSLLEPLVGDLEGDIDIMFVSGVAMVGAAVWTVMHNADLLTRILPALASRVGRLRPVLVTAVAYPMRSKFRTGLTLAMFALVIFTLVVMSVITETFTTQFEEPRKIYMGFDIGGSVNINSPVVDISGAIASDAGLDPSDFEVVSGYTLVPVELRRREGEKGRWFRRTGMLLDDPFLAAADLDMKLIAEGYGPTAEDVLEAMRADPSLADSWRIHATQRGGDQPR